MVRSRNDMHKAREPSRTGAHLEPAGVVRLACLLGLVGGAYYAGAAVGFALKVPPATPSVIWPPNAILTSALLLTAPRVWPLIVLAALPAHLAIEVGAGWPAPLVAALFLTNSLEAVLAAGGLLWVSDTPTRFDSLRRLGLFIAVVVVAAPFLSTFLDAAAVAMTRGEPYWTVWMARLFSNALAALLIVPAVVMTATSGWTWLTTGSRARHVEAAVIAAMMLLVGIFVIRDPGSDPVTTALAERATLAWLLPFLMWTAIRLGPGGLSLALLGSALLLTTAAVHSHGPFQGLSAREMTLALQIFIIAVSVPLLVVAALIEERRLAQHDMSERLVLEALLARLSGAFVHVPSNRMREVFSAALRDIGEALRLECLYLYERTDRSELTLVAEWKTASVASCPIVDVRELIEPIDRVQQRHPVIVETMNGSPDRTIRSGVGIPLIEGERLFGALACTTVTTGGRRAAAVADELQLVARVLAAVLSRKSAEDSLRENDATNSAILSSLTYGVVVVDREGRILTVNERWRQMIGDGPGANAMRIGADHLEFYRAAHRGGEIWAAEAADGIAAVLAGTSPEFRIEHAASPHRDRTVAIRALPLNRPEGGAVVTAVDLTDQRRAEVAAQEARSELAHVSRVATLGALTASIAHQLNQPLTGILANAQAAQRLLAADVPDLQEASLALEDIMDDDRRASEVIVRMRQFLRKETGARENVDMNAVVKEVARLVSSDAIIRNVTLIIQRGRGPAIVCGDRVQLQQVVLNLFVNALEALGDSRRFDGRIVVRSGITADEFVEVSVTDNGAGFACAEESAFEALYTTKPAGMGLGLSISRSIVEAHEGVIRAANQPDGGACVAFRLPRTRQEMT